MKLLLNIEIDTQTGNKLIAEGKIDEVLGGLLNSLKPEASYFYARNGRRAFTIVVDIPDMTHLPSVAEPFWIQMGASVEAIPVMTRDDLDAGLSRLG